jgi:hypothetical protein
MEAPPGDLVRPTSSLINRWLRNRWARWPLWFAFGASVAFAAAVFAEPRWVDFCSRVDADARPCTPIELPTMFGYMLIGGGLLVMVFGPIVNAFYHLARYGQKWETSRVETAVSNLPLISGVAYMILGFVVAWVAA